jgi:CheY-like chemotaxis protein
MPTVLLAENSDASRDALARWLELRNYQVLRAADGLQAVSIAREAKPDLIVMDLA